jgi:hypothetical protein
MRLSLPETQTYILHKYRQVLTDSQTRRTIRALMFRCVDFPWTSRNREMAEGEGFEPPLPVRVKRFSRPPVSTTHTSLREWRVHSDHSGVAGQSKARCPPPSTDTTPRAVPARYGTILVTGPASWFDTHLRSPYYLARIPSGFFLTTSALDLSPWPLMFPVHVSI